jgi:hypothetical protein
MSLIQLSPLPGKRPRTPDQPTITPFPDNAIAQKRPCFNKSSDTLQALCRLEQLPSDILQQIFFAALNGNLLRASPRIATKLSSRAVYRTAFFVAFYHQNLVELGSLYKYLLPEITTKIPYWELRSMIKIVLDSRWCTWGWFKTLHSELMQDAVSRFKQIATKEISSGSKEMLSGIQDGSTTWHDLAGYALHGTGENDLVIELDCSPFNICLTTCPAASMENDYDENGNEWEDAVQWRLDLCAFGTIPMHGGHRLSDASDERPFRADFNEVFGLHGSYGSGFPSDLWACLEGRIFSAVKQNNILKLRKGLQIDYFFHPEDMPYKISPRLFRTAIEYDGRNMGEETGLSASAVLFELDPYSLPCKSRAMREWAKDAAPRLCEEINERTEAYAYIRERQASDNPLPRKTTREFIERERVAAYMQSKERDMIRYMKDGVVKDERDLLSPAFDDPVLDDDIEKFMSEAESSFNNTMPSREHYLAMTMSQLRAELRNRGIVPASVGARKIEFIDQLILEDQGGNRHQTSFYDSDYNGDEDLESLMEFVSDMWHDAPYEDNDPASPRSDTSIHDEEDAMDIDEDQIPEDIDQTQRYNPNLDVVATYAEDQAYCRMLDRKEDYAWFEAV